MPDVRLFDLSGSKPRELAGKTAEIEKEVQTLVEDNLETFFAVRFLATEYSTGERHGGRIDTLGLDENNSPVIIEYKRSRNDSVITQGLYYLDWLLDHKSEFEALVQDKLVDTLEEGFEVEWSAPKLLCIAGSYSKFDLHATKQIDRNIDLVRYEMFEDSHIVFDLTNSSDLQSSSPKSGSRDSGGKRAKLQAIDRIAKAPEEIQEIWKETEDFIFSLGDDVNKAELDKVIAFKTSRNFVCGHVLPIKAVVRLTLSINPQDIELEDGFSTDISRVSRWGTGDVEIDIKTDADLEKAKPLIKKAYKEVG